ncbi:hypothetical protein GF420_15720 [candidate division GN15 bacterium]|nr:hypothetical protein [candidate division GN15 bacterium]
MKQRFAVYAIWHMVNDINCGSYHAPEKISEHKTMEEAEEELERLEKELRETERGLQDFYVHKYEMRVWEEEWGAFSSPSQEPRNTIPY